MNARAAQYPEALKKAKKFVRLVLSERQAQAPDAVAVTKAAQRIVRALPPYDHADIKSGADVVSAQ